MASTICSDEPIKRFATNSLPTDLGTTVNLAIDRYQQILAKTLPEFYPAEWLRIFHALQSNTLLDAWDIEHIWLSVHDVCREDALSEESGVDAETLTARLQALTYPELVAVAELKERFFRTEPHDTESTEQFIARLIAAMQDPQP